MSKLVSVIIPSYNHEAYIDQAIASVLEQTHRNIELIVIDDGSQDNSPEVISSFSGDDRLSIWQQPNAGAHAALNRGIGLAKGEYIAILNSDDIYERDRIETFLGIASELESPSLLFSYLTIIGSTGEVLGVKEADKNCHPYVVDSNKRNFLNEDDSRKTLLMFNHIATTSNFFFHRDVLKNVPSFKALRYAHDWDFALKAASYYPLTVVDTPLLKYRVHSQNTISENQARMILEICWVLANNLTDTVAKIILDEPKIAPSEGFLVQLLNSIYCYECDRTLMEMLVISRLDKHSNSGQDGDPDSRQYSFDQVLNPNSQIYQRFLSQIKHQLASQSTPINLKNRFKSLKKLTNLVKLPQRS